VRLTQNSARRTIFAMLPDMSSLETFAKEWPVIKAAPYSFIVCVGILVFIGWGLIWFIFRYRIEKYQESVEHLERDVKRLEKELERSPVPLPAVAPVPIFGTEGRVHSVGRSIRKNVSDGYKSCA
jgi:hypothetical protein